MPRFGELLPADVWAAVTRALTNPSGVFSDAIRTLTDLSLEDVADLPELTNQGYPPTDVVSSATSNTFGSWTQLVANVGTGKRLIGVIITFPAANTEMEVQIGTGASGSEASIQSIVVFGAGGTALIVPVQLFRSLADNVRLSARARNAGATALTYRVEVYYA